MQNNLHQPNLIGSAVVLLILVLRS